MAGRPDNILTAGTRRTQAREPPIAERVKAKRPSAGIREAADAGRQRGGVNNKKESPLSAIDDLIAQAPEPRLREQLKREWAESQKTKKFGLVFDRRVPELEPIRKGRPLACGPRKLPLFGTAPEFGGKRQ